MKISSQEIQKIKKNHKLTDYTDLRESVVGHIERMKSRKKKE